MAQCVRPRRGDHHLQALPYRLHAQAIANSLIAPAGTLLVIAAVHDPHEPASPTGPCPLRREEIDAFADADLDIACIELVPRPSPASNAGVQNSIDH